MIRTSAALLICFFIAACAAKNPHLTEENIKYFCLSKPSDCRSNGQPRFPEDVSANEKQRYERLQAGRQKQARIKATAAPFVISGENVLIAHADDGKSAFIFGTRPKQGLPFGEIERGVSAATGCTAQIKIGALAFAKGFSKSTSLGLRENTGLKVETYCEGDTRPRTKAAPASTVLRKRGETPFPEYPQKNATWLSYTGPHGFQITYLAQDGRSWLWYPGNKVAVPGAWRRSSEGDTCFTYGSGTYNPITKQRGGKEQCIPSEMGQRQLIAKLTGDPYNLSSGAIPYPRDKCAAPKEFSFDRNRIRCGL